MVKNKTKTKNSIWREPVDFRERKYQQEKKKWNECVIVITL